MNVPEKDEANPGCLGRGLLVSVVIAFAIGLMFLFPDGVLPPVECVPGCALIVLPGSIIWFARYIGKTKRVGIRDFGVALLAMTVMFLTCWEPDRLVKVSNGRQGKRLCPPFQRGDAGGHAPGVDYAKWGREHR